MKIKFKVFLINKTKVFLMINNFYINFIIIFVGHFIFKSGIVVSYMEDYTFICIEKQYPFGSPSTQFIYIIWKVFSYICRINSYKSVIPTLQKCIGFRLYTF